ncbi:TetR/AcrR family transcriptional regulator [Komarekiella sp. 'clone 1']|uniref:TetR/AcrR family transcriptional regulator n=1 Tax=Komarekiella delphini-convector SJRDD-AB1 TaxID=2593771 RepID=A0AA40T0R6_9NOST|nr:TetR/AcrR family transcriptional regulator [Komarekiella delphini-convector]MBD6618859.1 TetR/AcrR family transcriptional regulator [Komarekiella delphini-convector SJRDD-AB1]
MPKDTYIPCLLNLFRQYGYDGATLSKISQQTGLGKASLYHHFPGGKDDMVNAVLNFLESYLEEHILQALRSEGTALTRLQKMCAQLSELYEGGQQPCLFAILLMGSARDIFHTKIQALLRTWIDEIATVLIEAGLDKSLARQRGEDAVIAIQGSLILAQGLNDLAPFQRVVKRLPQELCRDIDI